MNENIKRTFKSAEMIDTISFEVFSGFVNTAKWFDKRSAYTGVSLEIRRSEFKCYYYVHIQEEALDPNKNMRAQVKSVIANLYLQRFINIPYLGVNRFKYIFCIAGKIIRLSNIDFHFDFRENEVFQLNTGTKIASTHYSTDHRKNKKSHWILYDRRLKLTSQNQLPWDFIQSIPYPKRIEIRLSKSNCEYINLNNLNGNFNQVFMIFSGYIAKSWVKHGSSLAIVNLSENHMYFNHIQILARTCRHIAISEDLKKTPPRFSDPLNKI